MAAVQNVAPERSADPRVSTHTSAHWGPALKPIDPRARARRGSSVRVRASYPPTLIAVGVVATGTVFTYGNGFAVSARQGVCKSTSVYVRPLLYLTLQM
jgi:hypothetical protein